MEKKTDVKVRLIDNSRLRIHHALKGELKSSTTKDILGKDIETCRNWVEFWKSPDLNSNNSHLDQREPIFSFDVSKIDELKYILFFKYF